MALDLVSLWFHMHEEIAVNQCRIWSRCRQCWENWRWNMSGISKTETAIIIFFLTSCISKFLRKLVMRIQYGDVDKKCWNIPFIQHLISLRHDDICGYEWSWVSGWVRKWVSIWVGNKNNNQYHTIEDDGISCWGSNCSISSVFWKLLRFTCATIFK